MNAKCIQIECEYKHSCKYQILVTALTFIKLAIHVLLEWYIRQVLSLVILTANTD